MAALVFATSCNHDIPVVDVGSRPSNARATIFGTVRGPEGTSPIVGRAVEIVNLDTGARQTVQTSSSGDFTVELPAGRYQVTLTLLEGETLLKHPGVVDLRHGEIKSHIEFVLTSARAERPHGPAYRVENGLGPPIA
jgi:hypothetical protein